VSYVPRVAEEDMPVDEEHFESIPWSALVPQARSQPWLVYVAAGAVVALVVGVVVARSVTAPRPATAMSVSSPATPVVTGDDLLGPEPVEETDLLSEADLLAEIAPATDGERTAVMRAEWFVTDYFTVDGAGGRSAELAGALGRASASSQPAATTYVEWSRAWAAVHEGDGRYLVPVAYRAITANETGFVRGLVHAVNIRVQVDPGGGTRILDLPEPIELPASPDLVALPEPGPVPEFVAERALAATAVWGEALSVVEGLQANGTWRVTVEVGDDQGTQWPLVVWVESSE